MLHVVNGKWKCSEHKTFIGTSSHKSILASPFDSSSFVSVQKNYLLESDLSSTLTEALTAEVQSVLADQTGLVGADSAKHHLCEYI